MSVFVRARIRRSCYRDSLVLMRLAEALRARPGVREAAALMGTPANRAILAGAGLASDEAASANPEDLVLAVAAESAPGALEALAAAEALLDAPRAAPGASGPAPRTLEAALRLAPEANLAMISVPGAHARLPAQRALARGLHVFLFSDNVPLADEVALKQLAVSRGLLCMGPDCGTAYLNGMGLGFANVVPAGRVGCVAASGTGLQAVVSRLAALGEGVSQGIGVGGRDLSDEVAGTMTFFALDALARDRHTEIIVLISKPPAPGLLPRLEAALEACRKPVVVCCLGARRTGSARVRWVETLEDAAELAAATLAGRDWSPRALAGDAVARDRLDAARSNGARRGNELLGLFTGGTLAHEARLLLEPKLAPERVCILDLGDDEFTVGRPHPMLDPAARAARVRQAGQTPTVGVLLVDLVLGRAAHPDPAGPLADAIADARRAAVADARGLTVIASVIGTERDPQGLGAQLARLEAGGAIVLPSSAQAARFAALALDRQGP